MDNLFYVFAAWVHDLDPFLIKFPDSFPLAGIRWYGVAYVAGFGVAALLLRIYYKSGRSPLDPDRQSTLMTAIVLGALMGGRLGYMFLYDFEHFLANPLSVFAVWQGGMASHGGFVGVVLALFWFAWYTKQPVLRIADICATLAPPGFFFGRIANFINGELWGKVTDVSWAVIFPRSAPNLPLELIPARHPSQLYAAALEGLVLCIYMQWRFWSAKPGKAVVGQLGGEFLIAYAGLRILGEQFREPDASLILGMSRGIFYSLFLIATGVVVIFISRRRAQKVNIKEA